PTAPAPMLSRLRKSRRDTTPWPLVRTSKNGVIMPRPLLAGGEFSGVQQAPQHILEGLAAVVHALDMLEQDFGFPLRRRAGQDTLVKRADGVLVVRLFRQEPGQHGVCSR